MLPQSEGPALGLVVSLLYLPCRLGLFHVSHPVHLGWSICCGLNMPHGPSLCASAHASPVPEIPALLLR